jgi:hypothetical protein
VLIHTELKLVLYIHAPRAIPHRLFDAMASGCIPVVFSDSLAFPFPSFLDWSEFVVQLDEKLLDDPTKLARYPYSALFRRPLTPSCCTSQSALDELEHNTARATHMRERLAVFRECFLYPPPAYLHEIVDEIEHNKAKTKEGKWWYKDGGRDVKCKANLFDMLLVEVHRTAPSIQRMEVAGSAYF